MKEKNADQGVCGKIANRLFSQSILLRFIFCLSQKRPQNIPFRLFWGRFAFIRNTIEKSCTVIRNNAAFLMFIFCNRFFGCLGQTL